MSTKPRLTGRTAVAAWPERLDEVREEPTDENLQRLCHLLDVVDAWIVKRWQTPDHEERRGILASLRTEARQANGLVSEAQREAGRRKAEQVNRRRAASRASVVAGGALGRGTGSAHQDGPAAA